MKSLPLVFDSTGFSYDVDNPTIQTEKLAYLLSQWLESEIDPVEATIPIWGGDELIAPAIASAQLTTDIVDGVAAAITNKEIPVADLDPIQCEFSGLSELIENIRDSISNLTFEPAGSEEPQSGLIGKLKEYLELLYELRTPLEFLVDCILKDEVEGWEGEEEPLPSTIARIEMAMADIAAASGVVLDAPGSVISVNRQTPEEP
jgi:hypothetical protein